MQTPRPTVTIVSPFYNATRWLPGLIETTRSQTWADFEHLLVDDCSTDGSLELARSLCAGDERFRVLQMPRNAGPAAARNLAIAEARGRYLAFLDADDRWLPEKLARQLAFMREHGHAFTYHDYRFLSEDGTREGRRVQPPDVLDVPTLHTRRGVGCLTVMLDRDQLAGFHFPEIERAQPEDHYAWMLVIQGGHPGRRLPEDLARYRVFQSSRSGNKLRAAGAMWRMFRLTERQPLARSVYWWVRYAIAAYRLHRYARP